MCSKLTRSDNGGRAPLFDLWHGDGDGFGTRAREGVSRDELFAAVAELG